MNSLEILAPAGSIDALVAAVRCGADAVYLGQKSFSARKNSKNFDEASLKEAVLYAHERGVAIHQALNIVVFDHELDELKRCIETALHAGVDAFIVQDMGVVSILRQMAPAVPLHASTQMAIHSPGGVETAKEMGFSRVVLARELSKEEIANIRSRTDLELEVFVHGAHCMSVSGQCYLSAVIGGKSGNRGQCAQPCRLPFSTGQKNEYALSLKDLSLFGRIRELKDLGVQSLKIEGRAKRPEYVAAAVTACRQALNGEPYDLKRLEAVFSRDGFTSAYFDGRLTKEMFGVRRKEDVLSTEGALKELALTYHKEVPLVPLTLAYSFGENEGTLTLSDGIHTVVKTVPLEKDGKTPLLEGRIRENGGKLGGTPYYAASVTVEHPELAFLPLSGLNALRREGVSALSSIRKSRPPLHKGTFPSISPGISPPSFPACYGKFSSLSLVTKEARAFFQRLILPAKELLSLSSIDEKTTAFLPPFLFKGEEQALSLLKQLAGKGLKSLYCDGLHHLSLAKKAGLSAIGGPFLNITNSFSAKEAARLGCREITLSFEGKWKTLKEIQSPVPAGVLVYGFLRVMALRSCPMRARRGCERCSHTLTDRKGISFPLFCDETKTAFLYNSLPLWMGGEKERKEGFSFLLFDFSLETKEEIEDVIHCFQKKAKWNRPATRGLYYRGVEGESYES